VESYEYINAAPTFCLVSFPELSVPGNHPVWFLLFHEDGTGDIVAGDFAVGELDRVAGDGSHIAFAPRTKGTMAGRACRPIFDRGRSGDRMFPVVETEVEFCKGK